MTTDPYAVLGLTRDATDAQVAAARHQLVRRYHPDVNHDPDATARFEDVQRAFDLLSDPAARAEYDRTCDVVLRSAEGGYSRGTEAAANVLVEPAAVDFGILTPQRPWADAKVTVAWTGEAWPENITRGQGNDWWRVIDSTSPGTSCVVFQVRAAAYSGGPAGQRHDQLTVTVNDTVLAVKLAAEFQGDFSAIAQPKFGPTTARIPDWVAPFVLFLILVVVLFGVIEWSAYHNACVPGQVHGFLGECHS